MSGVTLMASQIGGAITPLLVVPIQSRYGWRAPFFVFGLLGVGWVAVWYFWFRDSPIEKIGARQLGQPPATQLHAPTESRFPWRIAFRSQSALALMALAFCYFYVYNFFQTWFHTFLVKGRGFSEESLFLSALPYVVAAGANPTGGALSDALVRRLGLRKGRRMLGATALASAGLFTIAAMVTRQQILTVILLALVYGTITFQQSGVFGVCLDIGQTHAGAVVGLMNTSAQVGGLLGSVGYGYIVARFESYDVPFIPMATLLFLGALLWLKIDASRELSAEPQALHAPLSM
jgi:predicted MFS family arabinose efflux permease